MRLLTSRGHQADDNGGGGGWALDQHSHQDPHHQPCHGVRQHHIVLENVPGYFTWFNMQPAYTKRSTHVYICRPLVSDMTGLQRATLNKIQSACFLKIQKGHRWGYAVNYTALSQWDIVNCSAVTHLYVKHQLAESLSTHSGGSEDYSTYPLLTGRQSSECPRSKQRRRGEWRWEGSWIYF